jgi:hypothetical protein
MYLRALKHVEGAARLNQPRTAHIFNMLVSIDMYLGDNNITNPIQIRLEKEIGLAPNVRTAISLIEMNALNAKRRGSSAD